MKMRLILTVFFAIFSLSNIAHAVEPTCQSQTVGSHTSKLCVSQALFQHDYYTLWVDGAAILLCQTIILRASRLCIASLKTLQLNFRFRSRVLPP